MNGESGQDRMLPASSNGGGNSRLSDTAGMLSPSNIDAESSGSSAMLGEGECKLLEPDLNCPFRVTALARLLRFFCLEA